MYFPYLRGRQYELIALRELVEKKALDNMVIPVVEPVKLSSALIRTIEKYAANGRQLGIIVNPGVGNFISDMEKEENQGLRDDFLACIKDNPYILFFNLLRRNDKPRQFLEKCGNNMGTICIDVDAITVFEEYFKDKEVKYNLIPDDSSFRRRIEKNRVLLADRFKKQDRNIDYIAINDEFFSNDHLYYSEEGYVGFSDYSVVGRAYSDTGFAPYAVAIHIVYFAADKSLRIKHFVSDSNDDINDPAHKFYEALSKLVEWNKKNKLDTIAMEVFEDLYYREAYPGLGIVKKLSIMHHLELIGKYLDKE